MKVSQKGLYALQAMMTLARQYQNETLKIWEIAADSDLPGNFLELILVELRNARLVESVRGAKGGYKLRRAPSEIRLSEIIRLIDGPLAPFGDAEELRNLSCGMHIIAAYTKRSWMCETRPRASSRTLRSLTSSRDQSLTPYLPRKHLLGGDRLLGRGTPRPRVSSC
jgi:Rrf2 family protein